MDIITRLYQHDWYYMMSDDPRAYDRGRAESNALRTELKNYKAEDILPRIEDEHIREKVRQTFFA